MDNTEKPAIRPDEVINARKATGLSQTAAAHSVGVAFRTWQDWERGAAAPHWAAFTLFCHMAGLERIEFGSLKRRDCPAICPEVRALLKKRRGRPPKATKGRLSR
jgi:DNA-binding XRE family transcriptional regulator